MSLPYLVELAIFWFSLSLITLEMLISFRVTKWVKQTADDLA